MSALVEIATQPWGNAWRLARAGGPFVPNVSARLELTDLDDNPVTIYAENDPEGATLSGAQLDADTEGVWPGFIESGTYLLTEPVDGTVRRVEAESATLADPDGDPQGAVLRTEAPFIIGRFRLRDKWSAADFGAKFNGDDETAELQEAVHEARVAGRTLWLPEGESAASATVTDAGDAALPLAVRGAGTHESILNLEGFNFAALTGTIGAAIDLTASADAGDTTLTMGDTSSLAPGDYLWLRDTDQVLAGTASAAYAGVVGEVVRVKSVDSSTVVTIYGAVEQQMTLASGNLDVRKVDGPSVAMRDFTLRNPNPATYTGGNARAVQFIRCRRVRVVGVSFEQFDDDGAHVKDCVDWRFVDCDFYDLQDVGGRTPYGIAAVNGSVNGLVHNCRMTYGRHLFTTSGDDGEIGPAHILISHCQAWHATGSPFDTHPAGRHITFDTCEGHAGGAATFLVRSPKTRVLNPRVLGPASAVGIQLGGPATGSVVRGGDVRGVTTGVQVEANDCTVKEMAVEASSRGVRVLANVDNDAGKPAIDKVRVEDIHVIGNPSVAGVQFQGAGTPTRVMRRIYAPDATTPRSPAAPSVVAAASIALPPTDVTIAITGNTNIDTITVDEPGTYKMRFTGTPTVGDGTGNLDLAGNFVATAGDVLVIDHDGTTGREMSRSAN